MKAQVPKDEEVLRDPAAPSPTIIVSAFHYVSQTLGKWFRVILEPELLNESGIQPLELSQHEYAYDEAPQRLNIPVWKTVREPLWIQFGGEEQSPFPDSDRYLYVSAEEKRLLNELLENYVEGRRFYRFILGLGKLENLATASVDRMAGVLEKLYKLMPPERPIAAPDIFDRDEKNAVWRAFVFSFFLSIRARSPEVHVLVVPCCFDGSSMLERDLPQLGTFVGAYVGKPSQQTIDSISRVFSPIVRALALRELNALQVANGRDIVGIEDVIRSCAYLDKRVQEDVNQYRGWLKKNLQPLLYGRGEDEWPDLDVFRMTGGDERMLQLFDRIASAARDGVGKDGLTKGRTFFFSSEPGCGKENIATLCHLLSPRVLNGDGGENTQHFTAASAIAGGEKYGPAMLATEVQAKIHLAAIQDPEWLRLRSSASAELLNAVKISKGDAPTAKAVLELLRSAPLFNYDAFNTSLLNQRNFAELMFGSSEKPGVLFRIHELSGTVFLDEINTTEPGIANNLLRVLDKPHQIPVKKGDIYRDETINIQIVFGSNRTAEELLADGFNSAVVFRLAARPFRIPPLRERKNDIAIFVNHHLLKRRDDNREKLGNLSRISLNGLRLICELPWADNYRGLRAFLDDLIEERLRREVRDAEITFDDVIRAISRREAMRVTPTPVKAVRLSA